MRTLKPIRVSTALLGLAFLIACTSQPQYTVRKLPSGHEVRLIGMGPIRFGDGTTGLMLNYQTDLDLSNKPALKAEVEDVWSEFRYDVERGNYSSGIISAHGPTKGFFIKTGQSYNFVYSKGADGQWHMLEK